MINRATEALDLFVSLPIDGVVLDIGSEDGSHARFLESRGLRVFTLDAKHSADIMALWPTKIPRPIGAVWCSHTLEHSRNPGAFLDAIAEALPAEGWLAITVPPSKPEIVGGHLSIWNAGLLIYNLILAGFDCRDAKVKTYGYNISVIVRHRVAVLPELRHDAGDVARLSSFFPLPVTDGFDGNIKEINWS